ncbi:tetratricopeptide repeat protein, partial [Ralstonia pseudosolanacearum]
MPFLGIGFHVIVALFFAVHAVRTHQNLYWLFILFAFPLLGSVAYFFAIYLPELRYSRGARVATRAVSQMIDPNRAVREARNDFDRAPTVQHRLRLGEALLEAGDAKEARQHFEQAATGPFAGDQAVLLGLARAQFATGDAAMAATTLDTLFEAHRAARRQPDPTLLYARAL